MWSLFPRAERNAFPNSGSSTPLHSIRDERKSSCNRIRYFSPRRVDRAAPAPDIGLRSAPAQQRGRILYLRVYPCGTVRCKTDASSYRMLTRRQTTSAVTTAVNLPVKGRRQQTRLAHPKSDTGHQQNGHHKCVRLSVNLVSAARGT